MTITATDWPSRRAEVFHRAEELRAEIATARGELRHLRLDATLGTADDGVVEALETQILGYEHELEALLDAAQGIGEREQADAEAAERERVAEARAALAKVDDEIAKKSRQAAALISRLGGLVEPLHVLERRGNDLCDQLGYPVTSTIGGVDHYIGAVMAAKLPRMETPYVRICDLYRDADKVALERRPDYSAVLEATKPPE